MKRARFVEKGPQILQKGHGAKGEGPRAKLLTKGPHLSNVAPKGQTMTTLEECRKQNNSVSIGALYQAELRFETDLRG